MSLLNQKSFEQQCSPWDGKKTETHHALVPIPVSMEVRENVFQ